MKLAVETPDAHNQGGAALNAAYLGLRSDLLALVHQPPATVLDVGCAMGATGRWLKERYGSKVSGVELDPRMCSAALEALDDVQQGDLNHVTLAQLGGSRRFDLILLGDVLEHLIDPWTTLAHARALLTERGRVITSLPNVGHCSTLFSLVLGRRWPYRHRGIHDSTHLRFFTRRNLVDMYRGAGLAIECEARNLRIVDAPVGWNAVAKLLDFHPFRSYFTYQYLHRLRPERSLEGEASSRANS